MFSENLKQLRVEKRMTQGDLGNKIHVSGKTIGTWERGTRQPNIETINELANLFNVTTDYLLGRDGKEENSADTKDLQKFLEVNRKGMSFGDDPITDEQKEKLDIALKMIFEKYKDKR